MVTQVNTAQNPFPAKRIDEGFYRDRLMTSLYEAEKEVMCTAGRIDILTPWQVIEVKRYECWREAIGQLIAYGLDHPLKEKRLHLLLPRDLSTTEIDKVVLPACYSVDIRVSWEYEEDELLDYREINGIKFSSANELTEYVKSFRNLGDGIFELHGQELEFALGVINSCHWVERQFGGPVDEVRIKGNKINRSGNIAYGYFQVRSSSGYGEWKNITVSNYTKQAFASANKIKEIHEPQAPRSQSSARKARLLKFWFAAIQAYGRYCFHHRIAEDVVDQLMSSATDCGIALYGNGEFHTVINFRDRSIVGHQGKLMFSDLNIYGLRKIELDDSGIFEARLITKPLEPVHTESAA